MRIDKYLKLSRIIKRRSVAKEACESGKILINGVQASPSSRVNIGDKLQIRFGSRTMTVKVVDIKEHVPKDNASDLYEVISDTSSEKSCRDKTNCQ